MSIKNKLAYYISFFGPFKIKALYILFILLIAAVVETLGIGLLLPFLHLIIQGTDQWAKYPVLKAVFGIIPSYYHLLAVSLTLFIMIVLRGIFIFYKQFLILKFVAEYVKLWAGELMGKMMYSPLARILKEKKGVLLNNLVSEPLIASKCLQMGLEMVAKVVLSLFTLVLMFIVDWKIAGIACTSGIFIIGLQWKISGKYSKGIGKKKLKLNQEIKGVASECLQGVRQIKSFGMEQQVINQYSERVKFFEDMMVRFRSITVLPKISGEVSIAAAFVIFLLVYVYILKKDILSIIPLMSVFMFAFQRLYLNIGEILTRRFHFWSSYPSLKLVHELSQEKEVREEYISGDPINYLENEIRFQSVYFAYNQDHPLFSDLNLVFPKGKITGLVGASGCGKSTICDLLSGFYNPDNGSISIDKKNLQSLNLKDWRRMIGYVSQETFLFNLSIRENIRIGKPDATDEEVILAAKSAGAHEFVESTAKGYDTLIGENGVSLSGGQRQRIAIARALIRNPQILIFDEATSALDSQTERGVLETIRLLNENRVIIFVTHRITMLRIVDNMYVLQKGAIIEEGDYDCLVEKRGHFFELERISRKEMND